MLSTESLNDLSGSDDRFYHLNHSTWLLRAIIPWHVWRFENFLSEEDKTKVFDHVWKDRSPRKTKSWRTSSKESSQPGNPPNTKGLGFKVSTYTNSSCTSAAWETLLSNINIYFVGFVGLQVYILTALEKQCLKERLRDLKWQWNSPNRILCTQRFSSLKLCWVVRLVCHLT